MVKFRRGFGNLFRANELKSVRRRLLDLVLVILIPLLIITAIIAWLYADAERGILESRRVDQVNSLNFLMDGEIKEIIGIVTVLADMPAVRVGDFSTFREQALPAVSARIPIIAVLDETGQQLMSTGVPTGAPLPQSKNMQALRGALSGRTVITDVIVGTVARRPLIAIAVPIKKDGHITTILSAVVNLEAFTSLFAQAAINPEWVSAVLDHNGTFVARNMDSEKALGKPARPEAIAVARGMENNGVFYARTYEGTDVGGSFRRSDLTGFTSIVTVPNAVLVGPFWWIFTWYCFLTVLLIIVFFSLSTILGRRLANNIEVVAQAAECLIDNKPLPLFSPYVSELVSVRKAYQHAEEVAQARVKAEEKVQNILHELVHRSKNLIIVIQAIANHSGRSASSFEDFLPRYNDRLLALSATQDLLLKEGRESARLDDLVYAHLAAFHDDKKRVSVSGSNIILRREIVQPVGMALHELATNAVKYGALSVPNGRVTVATSLEAVENGTNLRIDWKESGGPRVKKPKRHGFGSVVVQRLVATSVDGHADLTYNVDGLSWSLTISPEHFEIDESISVA